MQCRTGHSHFCVLFLDRGAEVQVRIKMEALAGMFSVKMFDPQLFVQNSLSS